jgi:TetR/AcrR family transcriptional regulator, transcriptional repressor for nem operon
LNEDPLHGFLVGLKILAELMGDLPTGHPGCLVAAYCYQDRLFDQQVRDLNTSAVLAWRKRFRQRLDEIAALYPPKIVVDLDDLADMLSVIADGGIILSKVLKDRDAPSPGDALS